MSHFYVEPQVNGTLVTHSNHLEVVKLIKCKSFETPLSTMEFCRENVWSKGQMLLLRG